MVIFVLLRLCLYDAGKYLIRLMYSIKWSTWRNIYSAPCCLPTLTKWLAGLLDWSLCWSLSALPYALWPRGSVTHSNPFPHEHSAGDYRFTSPSPSLTTELLPSQGSFLSIFDLHRLLRVGTIEYGELVNGMDNGKLPLWCDGNVTFLNP